MRVLQITDPHLFADADASLRGRVTAATLELVLEHIAGAGWPADLVAMTGDVVQDDTREAYERFRDMLSTLGLPVHCVPGNHDVKPLMREVLAEEPFRYGGSVARGNWLVAGVDSCLEGRAEGCVTDAELDRLDKTIAASPAEHVLIAMHHPPVALGSRWLDELMLRNGERFLERIEASGRVRAVIFGHAHQEFEGRRGPIAVVGTPSTCRQFRKGSDDFDVDDDPPAYRRITLGADGTFDSELIRVPMTLPAAVPGRGRQT